MSRQGLEGLKKRIYEQEKKSGKIPSARAIEEKARKIAEKADNKAGRK